MTYSIVARDPTTSELGIAVQSRYFTAGRVVPWIEAGVGGIASQAFAGPVYGHEGLSLLRSGMAPNDFPGALADLDACAQTIPTSRSSSFAVPWCCSRWGESTRGARHCSGPMAFIPGRASCCFVSPMRG